MFFREEQVVETNSGYYILSVEDSVRPVIIDMTQQLQDAFFDEETDECSFCKRSFMQHVFQWDEWEGKQHIIALAYANNNVDPPEVCWVRPGWSISEDAASDS